MDKLQKFLEDLVGPKGFAALAKSLQGDNLKNFAAPRALLSWLSGHTVDMNAGESKTVIFPGTNDKFITIRKSTGESFDADLVSHGKVIKQFSSDNAAELPRFILEENGIDPSVPDVENFRSVMKSVGSLTDALVKASLRSAKKVDVKEGVQESRTPEEKDRAYYDAAEKDEQVKKPVPSVEGFQRPRSNYKTLPFQKEELKSAKEVKGEDHEVKDSRTPEEASADYYKRAEKDKQLVKPAPSVEEFQKPKGQFKTQPPIKKEEPRDKVKGALGAKDTEPAAVKLKAMRVMAPKGATGTPGGQLKSAMTNFGRMPTANRLRQSTALGSQQSPEKKPAGPIRRFGIPHPLGKDELLQKPYVSDAQRRWAHTKRGTKALGGASKVKEWDKESKGKKLPERAAKAGEMPAGAGIPKQSQPPKKPINPSKRPPQSQAAAQAQISGKGKQLQPKMPKPQKMPGMSIKSEHTGDNLRKFFVSDAEVRTPCEHCGKPQFRDGQFDPCLCFHIEKHSDVPFVKLVKSADGTRLEFRRGADPESVRAFLLTLKLGLLANKIIKGK